MTPANQPPRTHSSRHVRTNRRFWDAGSDEYDERHRSALSGRRAATWGLWRIPETTLRLLGSVRGKEILELGCGAGRWSAALADRGARPVGLDASRSQLGQAKRLVRSGSPRLPFVLADAELLPFVDESFDLVFCDWGAMTFCDPLRTVPECARILRPSGRFVFSTASPLRYLALDRVRDRQVPRLLRSYFDQRRVVLGDTVEFQLPYGKWIDLFRSNGLSVERLVESRPTAGKSSSYVGRSDAKWAERWPMEAIWSLRKDATG
jgi:ubiquinone/menaquinone biosynthesis C-methylase UbiE